MLTNEELAEIADRQQQRQELADELPPGQWLYDSFAFLQNCSDDQLVRPEDKVCIVVRRRQWLDALLTSYGADVLDKGTVVRDDDRALHPARVALYLEMLLDRSIERDLKALLDEVQRLRGLRFSPAMGDEADT
jgi:hypothetical protein